MLERRTAVVEDAGDLAEVAARRAVEDCAGDSEVQLRIPLEQGGKRREMVGCPDVVVPEIGNKVAPGHRDAGIVGEGLAAASFGEIVPADFRRIDCRNNSGGFVVAAIANHGEFEVGEALRQHGADRGKDVPSAMDHEGRYRQRDLVGLADVEDVELPVGRAAGPDIVENHPQIAVGIGEAVVLQLVIDPGADRSWCRRHPVDMGRGLHGFLQVGEEDRQLAALVGPGVEALEAHTVDPVLDLDVLKDPALIPSRIIGEVFERKRHCDPCPSCAGSAPAFMRRIRTQLPGPKQASIFAPVIQAPDRLRRLPASRRACA